MFKRSIFSPLLLILLLILAASAFYQDKPFVEAQGTGISQGIHPLSGYAWGGVQEVQGGNTYLSGIGWINFDPAFGGVFASTTGPTTAILTGYAWANPRDSQGQTNSYGWLSFNDYSGCPTAPCNRGTINLTTGDVTGWARFISAPNAGNNAGGWDGWVHLNGSNYGGKIDLTTNKFTTSSYFWGGTPANTGTSSVGWIHLCDGSRYCVSIDPNEIICPLEAPNSPASLTATPSNTCGGLINLSWPSSNPVGGYYIYRDGVLIHTTDPTATSYVDHVTPNTSHTYQIAAFNYCAGQYLMGPQVSSGAVTSSAACTPPIGTAMEFYARPDTVPLGGSCVLHYTVDFPANCNITQPTLTDRKVFAPITAPVTNQSTTTGAISKTLRYLLTCNNAGIVTTRSTTCYVAGDYEHL